MTKDEALKLALEALEANQPVNYCMNNNGERFPMMHEDPFRFERNTKAITAIKEALALAKQEPVAFDPLPRACNLAGVDYQTFLKIKAYMPVAPQRTWVGLTDEEINDIAKNYALNNPTTPLHFARAIEAKLKERNHEN